MGRFQDENGRLTGHGALLARSAVPACRDWHDERELAMVGGRQLPPGRLLQQHRTIGGFGGFWVGRKGVGKQRRWALGQKTAAE
jgi:hypothetical protein